MSEQGYEEVLAPNVYFDPHLKVEAAKILPGEYYATARDMVIVTVLGSCVSACVRDTATGIGGMNHFMLPGSANGHDLMGLSARYGTYAMEILINHLMKLGAKRTNFEAKVFGGGNVLRGFTVTNIGAQNADFVLAYLDTENIRVVAQDLLDIHPRKIYFFPRTGRVLVKRLTRVNNDTILEREKDYSSRLSHTKLEGEVELFS